jgi:hypothetical protein
MLQHGYGYPILPKKIKDYMLFQIKTATTKFQTNSQYYPKKKQKTIQVNPNKIATTKFQTM